MTIDLLEFNALASLLSVSRCHETAEKIKARWFADENKEKLFSTGVEILQSIGHLFRSDLALRLPDLDDILEQTKGLIPPSIEILALELCNAYMVRQAKMQGLELLEKVKTESITISDIGKTALELLEIGREETHRTTFKIRELAEGAVARWDSEKKTGKYFDYGISTLQDYLRLSLGDTFYIIGTPKSGKSWQLIHFAVRAAQQKLKTLFISCEMTGEELFDRVAAYIARVDTVKFGTIEATKSDYEKFSQKVSEIVVLPLDIVVAPGLEFKELSSRIYGAVQCGYKVIIVDYLQKINVLGAKDLRTAAIQLSGLLSAIAKKYQVIVCAACQANRSANAQDVTEVWQARESSAIESDADVLMTLADNTDKMDMDSPNLKPITMKLVQRKGSSLVLPLWMEKFTGHCWPRSNQKNDGQESFGVYPSVD